MKYTDYADLFHGNGEIDLPKACGIAAAWHPIKALCGNTLPAATLPFGKYSVSAYSEGYPTGYGINKANSGGAIEKLYENGMRIKGFSHFQNSGTGAIRVYYNYCVLTPSYTPDFISFMLTDEYAAPGYYSAILEGETKAELTVSEFAAYHRYTFKDCGGKIYVNLCNDGLYESKLLRGTAEIIKKYTENNILLAAVRLQGIILYFAVKFIGDGTLSDTCFTLNGKTCEVRVSVSAESFEDALFDSNNATADFDTVRKEADNKWNDALGKIEIDCDDENEKRLFYSLLYHTLVKPCDWGKGGFMWQGAPFVTDFSTFWDIYKTQLPLIYTLYPTVSADIVATLIKVSETVGKIPNTLMLTSNMNIESLQARMLAEHTLYDAVIRGVKFDKDKLLDCFKRDCSTEDFREFAKSGKGLRATHTLDFSEASAAISELCGILGDNEFAEKLSTLAENYKNAFDEKTGLMPENSEYYEGNLWNYSFRPIRKMTERIALCGSEKFEKLLDKFFGFTDREDVTARFEGFNNETDMESVWAYHYLGRHDRIAEIIEAADRYCFRQSTGGTGKGGIPGNNDSGAMSSCHIWNLLGMFPLSGQDKMLLSAPKFKKFTLHLSNGKDLTVVRKGDGVIKSAELNGEALNTLTLPASKLMQGGTLTVTAE